MTYISDYISHQQRFNRSTIIRHIIWLLLQVALDHQNSMWPSNQIWSNMMNEQIKQTESKDQIWWTIWWNNFSFAMPSFLPLIIFYPQVLSVIATASPDSSNSFYLPSAWKGLKILILILRFYIIDFIASHCFHKLG